MTTTTEHAEIAETVETAPAPKKRAPRVNAALAAGEIAITGLAPTRKGVKRALALTDDAFAKKTHAALQRKTAAEEKVLRYNLEYMTFVKAANIKAGTDCDVQPPAKRRRTASKAPRKAKKQAEKPVEEEVLHRFPKSYITRHASNVPQPPLWP